MPTSIDTLEALRSRFAVCANAAGASLPLLAQALTREVHEAGAVVLREGESGGALYLIAAGRVSVSVAGNGEPLEVATLGPGQWFGELAFFTGGPATATVQAVERTLVLALPRRTMMGFADTEPGLAGAILAQVTPSLAHRLRTTRTLVTTPPAAAVTPAPAQASYLHRALQALFGGAS